MRALRQKWRGAYIYISTLKQMGCISSTMQACITHHSRELYVENEEKRFQRAFPGYKDTQELKKKKKKI